MLIEKTKHFFGDRIDLECVDTGEMITLPIRLYNKLSRFMYDDRIFLEVSRLHEVQL